MQCLAVSRFYRATRFSKRLEKDPKKSKPSQSLESFSLHFSPIPSGDNNTKLENDFLRLTKVDTSEWPNAGDYYQLQKILGVGSSVKMFSAFCTLREEKCAIKQIDLTKRPLICDELLRDVQVMISLSHENVVTYNAAFVENETLWLVFNFMDNGSLFDVIERKMKFVNCKHGVFNEPTIATILTGVLSGLDYLHSNGYIHRDMKTENILICNDGTVQISDFLVNHTSGKLESYVGSPCWLPPEIIESSNNRYTTKSDIWSLGITTIEMVTGSPPHVKHSSMNVLLMTLLNGPPTLENCSNVRDQFSQYGKTLRNLIDVCLQKDLDMRPTATELLFHPFFKKAKDKLFLHQVLSTIPPKIESKFEEVTRKSTGNRENVPPRTEWILDDVNNVSHHDEEVHDKPQSLNSMLDFSMATNNNSEDIRSSKQTTDELRLLVTLKIRELYVDSPMIMNSAINKKRELYNITFEYSTAKDTPEDLALDLVREGMIDCRDKAIIANNLQKLVEGHLQSVTFPLNSDIAPNEAPMKWELIGFATLIGTPLGDTYLNVNKNSQ